MTERRIRQLMGIGKGLETERRRNTDLRQKNHEMLRKAIAERLGKKSYEIELGGWKCPPNDKWHEKNWPEERLEKVRKANPYGKCVYEPEKDPCRDECLFCGNPKERK